MFVFVMLAFSKPCTVIETSVIHKDDDDNNQNGKYVFRIFKYIMK